MPITTFNVPPWPPLRRAASLTGLSLAAAGFGYLLAWRLRWLDWDDGLLGLRCVVLGAVACALFSCRRAVRIGGLVLLTCTALLATGPFASSLRTRWFGEEVASNREDRLKGRSAADFHVRTIDGQDFRLSDHRGKIVVVEWWRSWCTPCLDQLPHLAHAASTLDPAKLVVVGVNAEPALVQRRVRDDLDLHFALLKDDGFMPAMYQTQHFPRTIVIGTDGRVMSVDAFRGYGMVRYLAQCLADGAPDVATMPAPLEATVRSRKLPAERAPDVPAVW